eukprot:gene9136-18926_t
MENALGLRQLEGHDKARVTVGKGKGFRFNIMVVGESGQGKTTFLKALLKRYVKDLVVTSNIHGDRPSKTVEISEIGSFIVDTDVGECDVCLFDTPGYGDHINNQNAIDLIYNYLDFHHNKWRNIDAHAMTISERNAADTRIHCIFYFISSHRMKEIDKAFLKRLADLAPIIPVIAKADTMKLQERHDFLCEVQQHIEDISRISNKNCIYDFNEEGDDFLSADDIEATIKSEHAQSVYFNIGRTLLNDSSVSSSSPTDTEYTSGTSNTSSTSHTSSTSTSNSSSTSTSHSTSKFQKMKNIFAVVCDTSPEGVREYPWGILRIYDETHSDFRRLQRLVFEE